MRNPSAKGSSFERELCRQFSLWWSAGSADDIFWRTAGSGARATTRHKSSAITKYQYGDMTFVRPEGQLLLDVWCFEFKRYHAVNVLSCLDPAAPDKALLAFWGKACTEAKNSCRAPFLVTRVDRGVPICWMNRLVYAALNRTWEVPRIEVTLGSMNVAVDREKGRIVTVSMAPNHMSFVGTCLSSFLDHTSVEQVKALASSGEVLHGLS